MRTFPNFPKGTTLKPISKVASVPDNLYSVSPIPVCERLNSDLA